MCLLVEVWRGFPHRSIFSYQLGKWRNLKRAMLIEEHPKFSAANVDDCGERLGESESVFWVVAGMTFLSCQSLNITINQRPQLQSVSAGLYMIILESAPRL